MISPENHDKHPCSEGHTWDMEIPIVSPSVHQVQYPELMNKPCDCGMLIWNEELCGCAIKQWEYKPLPNPNR